MSRNSDKKHVKIRHPDAYRGASYTPLKVNGIRGLIWRKSYKVAAPPLQHKHGGDKRIPQLFNDALWVCQKDAIKDEAPILVSYTEAEWKALASNWNQTLARDEARELRKTLENSYSWNVLANPKKRVG